MGDEICKECDECFLSFAGCGFLGLYHAGVCACIQNFAPQLYRNRKIAGASAGALAAASLVCELDANQAVEHTLRILAKAKNYYLGPFDPRFKVSEQIREGLELMLPQNAHELCSGRLYISLTSKSTNKNYIVFHYPTRADLIRALLCSAYIPLFSGFVPYTLHGEQMIDGGLSNNIPCLGRHTITVSPFAGEANICPRDKHFGYGPISIANNSLLLNFENMVRMVNIVWPKSLDDLQKLTEDGYNDALRFLAQKGFIRCCKHSVIGSGRVVFLTLQIRTHHGLLDHCPDCQRRLKEALSSSIPQSVRAMFSESPIAAGNSTFKWLKETRLFRVLQLLTSPTLTSMSILYVIIRRLSSLLSQMPLSIQFVFSPMKSILTRLNEIIDTSLRQSSNRMEQAKIICDSLKQNFPTDHVDGVEGHQVCLPSLADESLFTTYCHKKNLGKRSFGRSISHSTDDNISEGFGELADTESVGIFSESNQFSPKYGLLTDEEDKCDTSSTLATSSNDDGSIMDLDDFDNAEWNEGELKHSAVMQQMHALNAGEECEVRVDSLRPVNLNPFMYSHADDEVNENCCNPLICHQGIETVEGDSGKKLADAMIDQQVRSCWSYQDFEGSEVTKVFMVLPVTQ